MSDPALVHDVSIDGPAVHCLVVGCGAYTHLPGGSGQEMADPGGMGQLTSPPQSARAIADWLIQTCRSDKPLGTVSLLLSDVQEIAYTNPVTGVDHDVPPADSAHVDTAVLEWAQRGMADSGNRMIFFFSGHGLVAGVTTSLLLSDFGAHPLNRFKGALDFEGLVRGMTSTTATEQLFIVDVCRVSTARRLLADAKFFGIVPLEESPRDPAADRPQQAVLYSTVAGEKAYGMPGAASVYTKALIAALNGAGSQQMEEDVRRWRVDPHLLDRAVFKILKRRCEAGFDDAPSQQNSNQHLATFPIHDLEGRPRLPVFVRCAGNNENSLAEFACITGDTQLACREAGHAEDWELELEQGEYTFQASFPTTGELRSASTPVLPAYGSVSLGST